MISFSRINNNNYYILEFKDGSIVSLDKNFGGYPYRAISPMNIQYWAQSEKAESYARMFPNELNPIPIQVFGLFEQGDKK